MAALNNPTRLLCLLHERHGSVAYERNNAFSCFPVNMRECRLPSAMRVLRTFPEQRRADRCFMSVYWPQQDAIERPRLALVNLDERIGYRNEWARGRRRPWGMGDEVIARIAEPCAMGRDG